MELERKTGKRREKGGTEYTLPTAASPRRTSLTLLLGLGAFAESAMVSEPVDANFCGFGLLGGLRRSDARRVSGAAERGESLVDVLMGRIRLP